jgi:hypothetical protein
MHIYLVLNVEILKLYELSMLDQEIEKQVLHTMKDLTPENQVDLDEDTVLWKKSRTTR